VLFVKLIISVRSCTYIFVKVNVDASIMVRWQIWASALIGCSVAGIL
jgi:hypothetical protein